MEMLKAVEAAGDVADERCWSLC